MARANTTTLLTLDEFAAILGIHPLHFNQVEVHDLAPASVCGQPFVQYSWQQADSVSREEVAQAIDDAERQLALHLNFKLKPVWEINTIPFLTLNPRYSMTRFGHVAYGGREILLLEEAASAVVFTDLDFDGYKETATTVSPVTTTDVAELHLYYPGHYGAKEWEIPIVSATIAAGIATIITRRERLVLESKIEALNARAVDGLVDANFLSTVDVYRRYNDPSVGVTYSWVNQLDACGCGSLSCLACTAVVQDGCLIPVDNRLGIVSIMPATWDGVAHSEVCFSQCGMPDNATLYYKAGLPLEYGSIRNEFKRAIAYLAVSLLDRPICACDHIAALAKQYQTDLALAQASPQGSTSYRFSSGARLLDNPLGTTKGAVYAWRFVQRYSIGEVACGR